MLIKFITEWFIFRAVEERVYISRISNITRGTDAQTSNITRGTDAQRSNITRRTDEQHYQRHRQATLPEAQTATLPEAQTAT